MCPTDTGQVWGPHARFRRSDTWMVGSSSALCCEVLSRRLTSDLLLEAPPASAAFSGFVAAAVPKLGVDLFAHLFTLPPPGAGVCRSASCDFPRTGSPGAMASMEQTQSLKRVGVVSRWAPAAVGLLVWGRPDPPPPAGATSHTGASLGRARRAWRPQGPAPMAERFRSCVQSCALLPGARLTRQLGLYKPLPLPARDLRAAESVGSGSRTWAGGDTQPQGHRLHPWKAPKRPHSGGPRAPGGGKSWGPGGGGEVGILRKGSALNPGVLPVLLAPAAQPSSAAFPMRASRCPRRRGFEHLPAWLCPLQPPSFSQPPCPCSLHRNWLRHQNLCIPPLCPALGGGAESAGPGGSAGSPLSSGTKGQSPVGVGS